MPNLTLPKPRNPHVTPQLHLIAIGGCHSAISLSGDRIVQPAPDKVIRIGLLKAGPNIQPA
jgi:hypothetical protein